ncbi:hypothetical protein U1872_18325 [Sphingomonas sp. RB3P16]|uniref:hypothetical protein n=1 Tax=Parasphingomonas frigoris TaxID=3096163 RepID=UPI002FC8B12C
MDDRESPSNFIRFNGFERHTGCILGPLFVVESEPAQIILTLNQRPPSGSQKGLWDGLGLSQMIASKRNV